MSAARRHVGSWGRRDLLLAEKVGEHRADEGGDEEGEGAGADANRAAVGVRPPVAGEERHEDSRDEEDGAARDILEECWDDDVEDCRALGAVVFGLDQIGVEAAHAHKPERPAVAARGC